MAETLIEVRNVKKYFPVKGKKDRFVKAVDDVSFDVIKGEILGVVGESGCGKSTLSRCVMRLVDITSGTVTFDGQNVHQINGREMLELRKRMQMVFQNPFSSFNPKHSISKSLDEVGVLFGLDEATRKARISELLQVTGLDEIVLTRRPSELSGGQLQRLAIARALIPNPEFIMADEPVSALDVSVQAQILNLMLKLHNELSATIMFIAHDLSVVEHICDRVIVMYLGAIMEMGSADAIFSRTQHPYTQVLLGSKPKEHPDEKKERILLEGDIPSAMNVPKHCRFNSRCPRFMAGKCDAETPQLIQVAEDHWVACHLAHVENKG